MNNDHQNPLSTSAGGFAGHVLALQIDVDFADAGKLGGTSGMIFGDLRLCDLEPVWPSLPSSSLAVYNEMTVRQFLAEMNTALGGGALLLNPSPAENEWTAVAVLTRAVTGAFERGVPSQFAQDHIVKGPCPQGWQTDEVTYRG